MQAELQRSGHPVLAAALMVGLTGSAWAESAAPERPEPVPVEASQELELLKEEETVSIASRYEQPISQAPSNVYVITDEDIRHSGAIDIPTLLRRIPGMEVMQMNGADFNVSVRGDNQTGANKLLVMVDGRSIYNDVQGTVNWKALPVTLPEIKRIEVLKGPAAAVWGFNAFDGVINIITKSPEDMKGTTLQFGGGSYGTIMASAIQAGTVDKFGYRLSIGHNQNASWSNSSSLAFRDNLFNVLTEYALSAESKIKVSGGLVDSNAFNFGVSQDVTTSQKPVQGYASVAYERRDFFVRAFWNQYNATSIVRFQPPLAPFLSYNAGDGSPTSSFLANTYNIDVQHSLEMLPSNRVTYGLNYRLNTLSSSDISQYSTENRLGFFLQDEWKLAQPLSLQAGFRYDMDTFINSTVSPRVALLYTPAPNHTFRVSGSVAYRPPTLLEKKANAQVNTNPPVPPLSTSIVGGQSLSPEQIISYELGYQGWYWRHRILVRADAFYNHISDLISVRDQSPTVATYTNDNHSADIYGGEVGVEILATKWLTGFRELLVPGHPPNVHRSHPTGRPSQQIQHRDAGRMGQWAQRRSDLSLLWIGELSTGAIIHYIFSAPLSLVTLPNPNVGAYNLLNLRAGYRFWHEKAEVAVSAYNALNDKHQEYPLGETIGSRVMGWLTLRF